MQEKEKLHCEVVTCQDVVTLRIVSSKNDKDILKGFAIMSYAEAAHVANLLADGALEAKKYLDLGGQPSFSSS